MVPLKQVLAHIVVASISTVVSLITQVFGLIIIWNIHEARRNNAIVTLLAQKRSYFRRKLNRRRLGFFNRHQRSCWFKPGRTDSWWENMWNGIAPEECWRNNFRMSRDSFINLVAELSPYISPDLTSPNYRALEAGKKVALTLYFLKDTDCLGMTANTFGIAINTASAVITEVCQAISMNIFRKMDIFWTTKACRERCQNLRHNLGWPKLLAALMGHIFQLNAHQRTRKIFSAINNTIH